MTLEEEMDRTALKELHQRGGTIMFDDFCERLRQAHYADGADIVRVWSRLIDTPGMRKISLNGAQAVTVPLCAAIGLEDDVCDAPACSQDCSFLQKLRVL